MSPAPRPFHLLGLAPLLWALVLWAAGAPPEALAAPGDAPAAAGAAPRLRRFALLVGTNDGGEGRLQLRYAVSDARAFARVLEELGGVAGEDRTLLVEAGRKDFDQGLARLRQQLALAAGPGVRTEVLVYYSGHADEEGLLLKGERFPYRELRRALEGLSADVRIAILDSCASGAFARTKGGARRPAFLVDASSSVRGHAILTSSSEDEVSQESDRIGGSYFTHHLVSGLRGAADLSRDGRVTLNEAYHFAFSETLARTERTQAGPQHPAYDIELAGSGDLVMTDLRATSAGLVLADALEGRLSIRDAQGALVMELAKAAGRPTEVGLAPGRYTVHRELAGMRSRAEVTLAEGRRTSLAVGAFGAVATEAVAVRGGVLPPAAPAVAPGTLEGAVDGAVQTGAQPAAPGGLRQAWVNLGVLPGMDTNGLLAEPVENLLSLGLIAARSARLKGLALSFGGNWTDAETTGLQLALGTNVSGGDVTGAQVALVGNTVTGRVLGLQSALVINHARDQMTGLQGSVGANVAGGDLQGMQAAVGLNVAGGNLSVGQQAVGANVVGGRLEGYQLAVGTNIAAGDVTGLQAAVGANWAHGGVRGAQVGVAVNYSRALAGAQVALVNVGGDVEGAQVGLVNVARRVVGTQVGLVNLAGEMHGVPVGLLSLARNGAVHVEAYASDVHPANLALKLGTRHVYTVLTVGSGLPTRESGRYGYALGVGVHVPVDPFFADLEASSGTVGAYARGWRTGPNLHQLRLVLGWQVAPRFAVIAGPTLNWLRSQNDEPLTQVSRLPSRGGPHMQRWTGFTVGVRI